MSHPRPPAVTLGAGIVSPVALSTLGLGTVTLAVPLMLAACTPSAEEQPALTWQPGENTTFTLTGSGWTPETFVELAVCPGDIPVGLDTGIEQVCDLTQLEAVRADAGGRFATTIDLSPVVRAEHHREVVCLEEECVIGGFAITEVEELLAVTAPLEWPDSVSVPPPPTLALSEVIVDAETGMGTTRVDGAGFVPGSEVSLAQCPVGADGHGIDPGLCGGGTLATADEDGTFSVPVTVYPLLQRDSGEIIDCAAEPGTCQIAVPWPWSSGNRFTMSPLALP
ncbi:hypothetical protein [Salana multivorans]